jgi:hypothetical protein
LDCAVEVGVLVLVDEGLLLVLVVAPGDACVWVLFEFD